MYFDTARIVIFRFLQRLRERGIFHISGHGPYCYIQIYAALDTFESRISFRSQTG